jgi:hypothetical protein
MTDTSWAIGEISDTFRIVQIGTRGTSPTTANKTRFCINASGRSGYDSGSTFTAHANFV